MTTETSAEVPPDARAGSAESPSTAIEVSVIVVCWTAVDELRDCLDSLARSVDAPSFEVIVVLNGAPAGVEESLSAARLDTTIVRLAENVGFGAGATYGASMARGRYLAFLNDDTRVDPEWLARSCAAMSADGVGGVCSLLMNFDRTVQEAGSRVLPDARTVQWGRGLAVTDAESRGLLEPRAVDYGSAAALLVATDVFVRLGGFDPAFEPAYFEDVDLQFRIRQLGLAIRFEPSAVVYHHLGRSTAAEHWFRTFAAEEAGRVFADRWVVELATAPDEDAPVSELCTVAEAPPIVAVPSVDPGVDNSSELARRVAARYQAWLIRRVEDGVVQQGRLADLVELERAATSDARASENRARERENEAVAAAVRWRTRALETWASASTPQLVDADEFDALGKHAHSLYQQLTEVSAELERTRSTLSWRVTAPLRGLRAGSRGAAPADAGAPSAVVREPADAST